MVIHCLSQQFCLYSRPSADIPLSQAQSLGAIRLPLVAPKSTPPAPSDPWGLDRVPVNLTGFLGISMRKLKPPSTVFLIES